MKEVLEKGSVTLPTKDLSRYNTDTLSFMKEIGCIVMEDIVIPSDSGYFLIFHDPLKEYIVGEQDQNCFFNIYYDRDQNFSFYTKSSAKLSIPRDMRYIIVKA